MAWNPFRKRHESDLQTADRWRAVRAVARDDLLDLREQLDQLVIEELGIQAAHHARQALELYAQAAAEVRDCASVEDVLGAETLLIDVRHHKAALLALQAGEPVPDRGTPCFFDPRHGPSARDVKWSPPVGAERTVAVCADDAGRLEAGEAPQIRMIRVGDRHRPVHEVGGYQGVLDDHDRRFHEQSLSHANYKHLAQEDLWAPGTRFGGGGGGDGASSAQGSSGPS